MTSKSTNRLTVTKDQLTEAARTVGLGPVQSDAMWADLVARASAPSRAGSFSAADVFWYFGAAIVLAAMGWLATIVATSWGAGALLVTSVAYMAVFTLGGWTLASQRDLRVPGGLLYMLATVMTPVAVVSGAEHYGWHVNSIAEATIPFAALFAVGLLYTRLTRIAFVALPALIAGWLAATTGVDWLLPGNNLSWEAVSAIYGISLIAASFGMDLRRSEEDYAGWGYLVGSVAALVGFTALTKGEGAYVLYALGGVGTMLVSVLFSRKVFAFSGAAAVLIWIGHLSLIVFANSVLAPFVLTAIGVATIFGGVYYQRHSEQIDAAILGFVPGGMRTKLPRR
jgi:hypothetical protein